MISHNLNVRWKVVSIVSLPQHLLSLFPNAFSLSPRNGNSVCLSVPGFFVIGFSYIFWSQDFRDFFLSGFSSLLHLLVKSDHFNRFLTIVIIITIVLIFKKSGKIKKNSKNSKKIKNEAGAMYCLIYIFFRFNFWRFHVEFFTVDPYFWAMSFAGLSKSAENDIYC